MLLLLLGICCGTATAQTSDQKAEVIPVLFPDAAAFTALSDNGLWAVACGPGEDQSSMFYPYLINTTTGEYTPLWTAEDEANLVSISVNDVTNDGNIIVGNHGGAAYYNVAEGQWHQLPGQGGEVTVVTPDGKYIGGWTKNCCVLNRGEKTVFGFGRHSAMNLPGRTCRRCCRPNPVRSGSSGKERIQ